MELKQKQIFTMIIESIRRTVKVYYQNDTYQSFTCRLRFVGLNEKETVLVLKNLSLEFTAGAEKRPESD